ncbi:hypothetical protein FQA47_025125 [Oryzias melastigma]|uniref:Uncharacterized protein n=1 Tax=Oryzias melastigma TaxID=30732 RepID=A0A834C057_ORYME|nr:hypothetical protein FQA47_025125 [Oryzias melastigma]
MRRARLHHSGYLEIINFQPVAPRFHSPHTDSRRDYPECCWLKDRPGRAERRRGWENEGQCLEEEVNPQEEPEPAKSLPVEEVQCVQSHESVRRGSDPTPQRRRESRRENNKPRSQEVFRVEKSGGNVHI